MNKSINTCQNVVVDGGIRQKSPVKSTASEIYSNYSIKQIISSGSETDVSTSTENLSPEEHYVLKTSTRQEPQGEETYFSSDCLSLTTNNTNHNNNNTLIIHGNDNQIDKKNFSQFKLSPFYNTTTTTTTVASNNKHNLNMIAENLNKQSHHKPEQALALANVVAGVGNNFHQLHNHTIIEQQTKNIDDKNNELIIKNCLKNDLLSLIDNDNPYSNINLLKYANIAQTGSPSLVNSQLFINNDSVIKFQSNNENKTTNNANNSLNASHSPNTTTTNNNINNSNTAIHLQQPMLNNYLNSLKKNDSLMFKNFNIYNLELPLTRNCEKPWQNHAFQLNAKSLERFTISRSHPDLHKFSENEITSNGNGSLMPETTGLIQYNANVKRNATLEMLLAENSQLRTELDFYHKKVQKFQKVEAEIQKIYQSYDELMQSSEKKEKFEKDARYKLEIEVKKLQKQNKCLQEQLDANVSKKMNNDDPEFEKELNKRGALISYLLAKNKELSNFKERQEIELEAQRLTLQEQRNHIEILDTALINAQNNIMTLENELRVKQGWQEKTLFLEKALSNLQSTNERRLQMEKRIRTYLEKELKKLKNINDTTENDSNTSIDKNKDDVESLKSVIVNYEKRIIDLEAEVSKWEQKYLEENTLRSIEVSAASAPKDAKIAALERTSQESEKLIAEARSERLKHMDEIHIVNKKCTELESKLKDLNFKLAEKETIIQVLQKHSDDRDAVLQKTLRFTNARHAKSASTMGLVANGVPSGSIKNELLPNDYHQLMMANRAQQNLVIDEVVSNNPVMNFDEQLKGIDSQLSNKDSIINALRSEKERYPNHYNNWRL